MFERLEAPSANIRADLAERRARRRPGELPQECTVPEGVRNDV
jgi:hypothetical protein